MGAGGASYRGVKRGEPAAMLPASGILGDIGSSPSGLSGAAHPAGPIVCTGSSQRRPGRSQQPRGARARSRPHRSRRSRCVTVCVGRPSRNLFDIVRTASSLLCFDPRDAGLGPSRGRSPGPHPAICRTARRRHDYSSAAASAQFTVPASARASWMAARLAPEPWTASATDVESSRSSR